MTDKQPERDPLVGCPRNCGYKVRLSKSGEPHTIADPANPGKMKTCKY